MQVLEKISLCLFPMFIQILQNVDNMFVWAKINSYWNKEDMQPKRICFFYYFIFIRYPYHINSSVCTPLCFGMGKVKTYRVLIVLVYSAMLWKTEMLIRGCASYSPFLSKRGILKRLMSVRLCVCLSVQARISEMAGWIILKLIYSIP